VQAAAAGGAHARFEEVEGHDHTDILRWAALPERVDALVAALPR